MNRRNNLILLVVSLLFSFAGLFAYLFAWTQLGQEIPGIPGFGTTVPASAWLPDTVSGFLRMVRTIGIVFLVIGLPGILYFTVASTVPRSDSK